MSTPPATTDISSRLQNLLKIPSTSSPPSKENEAMSLPLNNPYMQQFESSPGPVHERNSRAQGPPPLLDRDASKENEYGQRGIQGGFSPSHFDSSSNSNMHSKYTSFPRGSSSQEWNSPSGSRRLSEVNTPQFQYERPERRNEGTPYTPFRDHSRMTERFSRLFKVTECHIMSDVMCNADRFVRASVASDRQRGHMDTLAATASTMDPFVKSYLKVNGIVLLSKRNGKFPRAKFFCECCKYHIDSLFGTIEHILQPRHVTTFKVYCFDYTIMNMPFSSDEHAAALGKLILANYKTYGMSKENQAERAAFVKRIESLFHEDDIECDVSLFGSSVSGLGFVHSDVNINVTTALFGANKFDSPEKCSSPSGPKAGSDAWAQVDKIVKILKKQMDIRNVSEVYNFTKVSITFETKLGGMFVQCKIQFNNAPAIQMANLFREYAELDQRLKHIVFALRFLAQKCSIDDQENGYIPSHCYTIMAIYYLQSINDLPVLHSMVRVDPTALFATAKEVFSGGWKSASMGSSISNGVLWLNMLKFFASEFDYKEKVISITNPSGLSRNEKWWSRKLSIEDPIIPMSNLARSAANNKACDIIIDVLRKAYVYFSIPRMAAGPLYNNITDDYPGSYTGADKTIRYLRSANIRTVKDDGNCCRELFTVDVPFGTEQADSYKQILDRGSPVAEAAMIRKSNMDFPYEYSIIQSNLPRFHFCLRESEYEYEFGKVIAPGSVPLICKACSAETHGRRNCPEEALPTAPQRSKPNADSMDKLQKVIDKMIDLEKVGAEERNMRIRISNEMLMLLQYEFPDIEINLYGSSMSGFELCTSDVDICMTLRRYPFGFEGVHIPHLGPPLTQDRVLHSIVDALNRSPAFKGIHPITSAKVPIIKFKHRASGMEGDVSLYNTLALHNTELLRCYSQIDPRVQMLGCFLKKLMKICDISDASKGTLSSYAFILMLIHYLQQIRHPLVPVLQEILPIGMKEEDAYEMKEGCNIYFYKHPNKLSEVWPSHGKNKESVAQLWLGFLNYYTHEFDFENNVISISTLEPVTRKEKWWFTGCIAIEDPFEKNHNLGTGLSKRMSVHILKTIHHFSEVFHKNVSDTPVEECFDLYCNPNVLRKGDMPIDRQCRICRHIGHIAKNCPIKTGDGQASDYEDDASRSPDNLTGVSLASSSPSTVKATVAHNYVIQTPYVATETSLGYPLPHPPGLMKPVAPTQSHDFFQPQQHSIIPHPSEGYNFFWKSGKGHDDDIIEEVLIRVVQLSRGVNFGNIVKERFSEVTKQPNPMILESNLIPIVKPKSSYPIINGGIPFNFAPHGYFHPQPNFQAHTTIPAPYDVSRMPPPGFAPIPIIAVTSYNMQTPFQQQNYHMSHVSMNGNGMPNAVEMDVNKLPRNYALPSIPAHNYPNMVVRPQMHFSQNPTPYMPHMGNNAMMNNGYGFHGGPSYQPMRHNFHYTQYGSSHHQTATVIRGSGMNPPHGGN